MSSLSQTRRLLLMAMIVLLVPLLAACGNDDDDNGDASDDAADVVATATVADVTDNDDADPTPETGTTPESEATAEADTTATTADTTPETDMTPDATGTVDDTNSTDGTATADTDSTPDATMDSTPDTTPDAASTPDGMGTPDTDGPMGGISDLTAEVSNFTLNFTGDFENVPDDTGAFFTAGMEMFLEQTDQETYHLRFVTTGDEAAELEMWSLEDATYIAEAGGEPIPLPAGTAGQVAPTEALMVVPPVETLENAEEVGEDEVDGRTATHYRVDPEEAATILVSQNVEISNPQGDMDIWIDEELEIVLRMTADITFENTDGSEGAVQTDYEVTSIDETEEIEAPS